MKTNNIKYIANVYVDVDDVHDDDESLLEEGIKKNLSLL